jgi:2-phosphosulfolactate phosphatase
MNISIEKSYESLEKFDGFVVVIDVFRAFSTACYVFEHGAKCIYPIVTLEEAFALKKLHPEYVLIGERDGEKVDGVDFGNSPAEMGHADFSHKQVIMTTSAGTKGLVAATKATKQVITASFVNIGAVSAYIKQQPIEQVRIICTDNRWEDNEDAECAEALKCLLESKPIDTEAIHKRLLVHPSSQRFLQSDDVLYRRDFDYCMAFNRFNFILLTTMVDHRIVLKKVDFD